MANSSHSCEVGSIQWISSKISKTGWRRADVGIDLVGALEDVDLDVEILSM
jgi:hypothetical protein